MGANIPPTAKTKRNNRETVRQTNREQRRLLLESAALPRKISRCSRFTLQGETWPVRTYLGDFI